MAVVCFLLLAVTCVTHSTTALQWASLTSLPDGSTIPACIGDNVSLPWTYEAAPGENIMDTEWYFSRPSGPETVIASHIRDNFLVAIDTKQHVTFLPNAGLHVLNVSRDHSGNYTVQVNAVSQGAVISVSQWVMLQVSDPPVSDGKLHVHVLDAAILDPVTSNWHAQLSCSSFQSLGDPPASVVWTTPDQQTLPSTSYSNGSFFLTLPEQAVKGVYSCHLEHSPYLRCLGSRSALHDGASANLHTSDMELSVLQARTQLLLSENTDLKHRLAEAQDEMSNCTAISHETSWELRKTQETLANETAASSRVRSELDLERGGAERLLSELRLTNETLANATAVCDQTRSDLDRERSEAERLLSELDRERTAKQHVQAELDQQRLLSHNLTLTLEQAEATITNQKASCDTLRSDMRHEITNLTSALQTQQEHERLLAEDKARLEADLRNVTHQCNCPTSLQYTVHSGRCVKLFTDNLNYTDARQRCRADGGHLYFFRSRATDTPIVQGLLAQSGLAPSRMGLWMGADRLGDGTHFMWSDGTPLSVDDPVWFKETSEPNNLGGAEQCVELEMAGLNDNSCFRLQMFVCEVDLVN